jgi:hypothetical protein
MENDIVDFLHCCIHYHNLRRSKPRIDRKPRPSSWCLGETLNAMPKRVIINLNCKPLPWGMYRLASRTIISQARTSSLATSRRYIHSAPAGPARPDHESEVTSTVILADIDVRAESHGMYIVTYNGFFVFFTHLLQAASNTTRRMAAKSLPPALQLQPVNQSN